MENTPKIAFAIFLLCALVIEDVESIGVNYGTLGNNLLQPAQVAQFLKDNTIIDRVKIFDAKPEVIKAFADTGILVAITIPNGEIPALTKLDYATEYITKNVKPFYPSTKINYICIGNEVLHWGPQNLIDNLVAAMTTLDQALNSVGIKDVKVTSPQSLAILEPLLNTAPPSLAHFRAGWDKGVIAPMLQYHRDTKSPFMVNPYPYFGFTKDVEDFAVFRRNDTVTFDAATKKSYSNMFDLLLDSVYISMKKLGFQDVGIVVGETGWPSLCGPLEPHCSVTNAASYNGGLLKKANSGEGTPLMPNRKFEIYTFGLFNENEKPGPEAERNFGLFWPDFTEVYKIGIVKAGPLKNDYLNAHVDAPAPAPATGNATVNAPAGKTDQLEVQKKPVQGTHSNNTSTSTKKEQQNDGGASSSSGNLSPLLALNVVLPILMFLYK
ncbi:hypothetical protein Leryth_021453 [Lithospermum erythrorhizon]|uniref:glucan endo-1,3-beta-D-glucosidase n=1 Tax=Lithospermum erythrorhizon TaxID=34254 RepID=A0AAV3NXW5_LITER|nr:hypothetical protein Leryth_021453 [Lithospermum erythrorhizon]